MAFQGGESLSAGPCITKGCIVPHMVLWLRAPSLHCTAPNHQSCDFFFFFNSYYFSPMILFSLFLILCLGEGRQGTAEDLYCCGFLGVVGHNLTFK